MSTQVLSGPSTNSTNNVDSDSDDEITVSSASGLTLKKSCGSDIHRTVTEDEDDENASPNKASAPPRVSGLRAKAMAARKSERALSSRSAPAPVPATVPPPVDRDNDGGEPEEEEEEEMLCTQHMGSGLNPTSPAPRSGSGDSNQPFDESAFLPSPPPPAPAAANNDDDHAPKTLSQTYSPTNNLPQYSEAEMSLALSGLRSSLTSEHDSSLKSALRSAESAWLARLSKAEADASDRGAEAGRLRSEVSKLEGKITSLVSKHSTSLSSLAEKHESELEAIVSQLDSQLSDVESTYESRVKVLEGKVMEKDAVVGAVGGMIKEVEGERDEARRARDTFEATLEEAREGKAEADARLAAAIEAREEEVRAFKSRGTSQ